MNRRLIGGIYHISQIRQKSFRNSKFICGFLGKFIEFLYSFRGFYSRKYVHDFHARKKYLTYIKDKVFFIRKKK